MTHAPAAVEGKLLVNAPVFPSRGRRWRTTDIVAAGVTAFVLVIAVIGPWITPSSALHSSILDAFQAPSSHHWFGTDDQGRDVFWRVVDGARLTLLSSIVVVVLYSLVGVVVAC